MQCPCQLDPSWQHLQVPHGLGSKGCGIALSADMCALRRGRFVGSSELLCTWIRMRGHLSFSLVHREVGLPQEVQLGIAQNVLG